MRSVQGRALAAALRKIGYSGPVDQDGYATEGPGTQPRTFGVDQGHRHDPRNHGYLATERRFSAILDGGHTDDSLVEDMATRKGWRR